MRIVAAAKCKKRFLNFSPNCLTNRSPQTFAATFQNLLPNEGIALKIRCNQKRCSWMAQKVVEGSQRVVGMKRGFNRIEAATFVGISPSKFDELVKDGRMPAAKHIDGRKVWDICELNPAFDELGNRDTSWDNVREIQEVSKGRI